MFYVSIIFQKKTLQVYPYSHAISERFQAYMIHFVSREGEPKKNLDILGESEKK